MQEKSPGRPAATPEAPWSGVKPVEFTPEWALPLLEQSGLILFRFDPRTRQGGFSRTAQRLLGYTAEEIERDPDLIARAIDPEDALAMAEFFRKNFENPVPQSRMRVRFRARDGRSVWVDALLFAVRDAAGVLTAFQGVAWDATDLVTAQRAAEEGRERFRVLFEEAPIALLLYSPDRLVIRQANARAAQMYGMRREELEGCFLSEVVAPDEWPRTQALIRSAPAAPAVNIVQRTLHRRGDGAVFPVQVLGVDVHVEGVRLRLAAVRDLTAEEESAENIRELFRALDISATWILVLDATWSIDHANPAFAAASQFGPDELIGRDVLSLLDPASHARFAELRSMAEKRLPASAELLLRRKSGATVRSAVEVAPTAGGAGPPSHYTVRLEPIGAPVAPPASMAPAEAAVFFDLLAHDVTNYLTAVRGYLELALAAGDLSGNAARLITVAREQSEGALDLVRETRHMVDLERDEGSASSRGDLLKILDEAVARIDPLVRGRTLKVRREYRLQEASVSHPGLLREVLVNLLHNAIKFDAHDPVVIDVNVDRVVREGKAAYRVRVADRGRGIADADKPHLFARGYRPAGAVPAAPGTMAPSGSGIGLSVCKFLIERRGGTVTVENRIPGDHRQGTAFVLMLPSD